MNPLILIAIAGYFLTKKNPAVFSPPKPVVTLPKKSESAGLRALKKQRAVIEAIRRKREATTRVAGWHKGGLYIPKGTAAFLANPVNIAKQKEAKFRYDPQATQNLKSYRQKWI